MNKMNNNSPQVVDGMKPDKNSAESLIKNARVNLLLMTIFTALNIVLTALNANVTFLWSSSIAMVAQIFGSVWGIASVGLLIALVIAAVFLFFWMFCHKKIGVMVAALTLSIVDTICLIWFIFWAVSILGVQESGFGVAEIIGVVYHVFLVISLIQGIKGMRKLQEEEERKAYAAYAGTSEASDTTIETTDTI